MSKITLTNLVNLQNETTAVNAINSNNAILIGALDNTLSRDGTSPNQMNASLDMNSNQILNLPSPSTANSPVRLTDINSTLTPTPAILSGSNVYTGNNSFTGTTTFATGTFWNNIQVTKTSNYTVVDADHATTLTLGGGTFFTLAVNFPVLYRTNFFVFIENADTRGKRIIPSGVTPFILWPNQSCIIAYQNGNWFVSPGPQVYKLTAPTTFYVDNVNGSDNNDGLAAGVGAFASIQFGIDTLSKYIDANHNQLILQVSDGTYTENPHLMPVRGVKCIGSHNELFLQGNIVSLGNTILQPADGACLHALNNVSTWHIRGFKFKSTGPQGVGINCEFLATIYLGNNIFDTCTLGHFGAAYESRIEIVDNYSVIGGGAGSFSSHDNSMILFAGITVTYVGSPVFTAPIVQSYNNSLVQASGSSFAGTPTGQRFFSVTGGGISTSTANVNFFPGTVAGAFTAPGWYS